MLTSNVKKPHQEALLYSILGRLDYVEGGKFVTINDPAARNELEAILVTNKLDGTNGAAYIYNKRNRTLSWGKPLMDTPLNMPFESAGDLLQFKELKNYQFAALNFWLANDNGSKEYFQLVIAEENSAYQK